MAARKLGVPSVITMHGGDVYVNPEQGYDFPTRWYVRPALRWTLRHAGALTAITEDCRQHALRAGAPAENIRLVFNGTDLRRFSPDENGDRRSPRFGPNMIFACRQLFPRKGIRFLLEAAAQLKPQIPRSARSCSPAMASSGPSWCGWLQRARDRRRRDVPRAGCPNVGPARRTIAPPRCRSFPRWRRGSAFPPPRQWAAR